MLPFTMAHTLRCRFGCGFFNRLINTLLYYVAPMIVVVALHLTSREVRGVVAFVPATVPALGYRLRFHCSNCHRGVGAGVGVAGGPEMGFGSAIGAVLSSAIEVAAGPAMRPNIMAAGRYIFGLLISRSNSCFMFFLSCSRTGSLGNAPEAVTRPLGRLGFPSCMGCRIGLDPLVKDNYIFIVACGGEIC